MSKSKYKTIDGYYKETQLYKKGWQKADIAEFLTKNNCRMKYDSTMQYYYIDDVHNAEETYFIEGNPRMGKYSGKDYRDTACRFNVHHSLSEFAHNIAWMHTKITSAAPIHSSGIKRYVSLLNRHDNPFDKIPDTYTLNDIINMAISYYNEYHQDHQITIEQYMIDDMCYQYQILHDAIKNDVYMTFDETSSLGRIMSHKTTIFMAKLLLFYLFDHFYKDEINRVRRRIGPKMLFEVFVTYLYQIMIKKCAVLDVLPQLQILVKEIGKEAVVDF